MECRERPEKTPLMILKAIGLCMSMALGFGAAFYAGYNSMPYILPPCIILVLSCSTCSTLLSYYIKGRLFEEKNLNSIKGSFWIGCVLLCLSVAGCFFFAIADLKKIFMYKERKEFEYGLYVALVPCVLSVFWSSVLIYDARFYWRMSQQVMGNAMAGTQIAFRPYTIQLQR